MSCSNENFYGKHLIGLNPLDWWKKHRLHVHLKQFYNYIKSDFCLIH